MGLCFVLNDLRRSWQLSNLPKRMSLKECYSECSPRQAWSMLTLGVVLEVDQDWVCLYSEATGWHPWLSDPGKAYMSCEERAVAERLTSLQQPSTYFLAPILSTSINISDI